jgi:hypothetical protein
LTVGARNNYWHACICCEAATFGPLAGSARLLMPYQIGLVVPFGYLGCLCSKTALATCVILMMMLKMMLAEVRLPP